MIAGARREAGGRGRIAGMRLPLRFGVRNALLSTGIVAVWCAVATHGPTEPNALSRLVLVSLPPTAAFALLGRTGMGFILGCFLAFFVIDN
jgi:hypothetical protein